MKVGILALQGDYAEHQQRLDELGSRTVLVRKLSDLTAVSALVVPGGESTVLLRLLGENFRRALAEFIGEGHPTLGTCAGLILLAKGVTNPKQESLGLLDVDVERNGYGRQLDSFIDPELRWTEAGKEAVQKLDFGRERSEQPVEGVFIRAPRITRIGKDVTALIERGDEAVLVRERHILGAAFHPELSEDALAVHQLFLRIA
jgi:5'-phosphate synthase pdxT subunit